MFVDYCWSQIRIEEVNLEFIKRRVLMQEICNQLCAAILNLFSNKNKTKKQQQQQQQQKGISI